MDIESFREYCLAKPGVTEGFPFDETTLVFKVEGKIFALTDTEETFSINLKCDPDVAIDLREHHACVQPGYHMNKKHWNTVLVDGTVDDKTLQRWIDHSYELVAISKKPKPKNSNRKPETRNRQSFGR
jgi:predicted DNA-binding protein (MmcQ/YjbR family)